LVLDFERLDIKLLERTQSKIRDGGGRGCTAEPRANAPRARVF